MLVEYQLPLTSKRADVVLVGQHPQTGRASYLVVELKQWSEAERFEDSDVLVRIDGYGNHPVLHPLEQVRGYCDYLTDFVVTLAEDELDDPRSLALPDWEALERLAAALVARSSDRYEGWGDVVRFAACTAARIGEVSGARVRDIDRDTWTWTVCRQTTPGPGGLIDKGTKGKRRRMVPIIPELRPLVARRLDALGKRSDARLFTGPRGGRISTAVLRDATHWDEVVVKLLSA